MRSIGLYYFFGIFRSFTMLLGLFGYASLLENNLWSHYNLGIRNPQVWQAALGERLQFSTIEDSSFSRA